MLAYFPVLPVKDTSKFIQIAACAEGPFSLYALTERGTVFFYDPEAVAWRPTGDRRLGEVNP